MKLKEFETPVGRHTELNPRLWTSDRKLKPQVRRDLIRIAEDFLEFCEVEVEIEDLILYGGNANYNYTEHSDIDLHLVVDFDSIACDRELEEMFESKRRLYKLRYPITVVGIDVEVYVEDRKTTPVSSSYSIASNQWIREPNPQLPSWDQKRVEQLTDLWTGLIDRAVKSRSSEINRTVLKLLKQFRKRGLASPAAEFSSANLAFKALRNQGTVDQLIKTIDLLHARDLSS